MTIDVQELEFCIALWQDRGCNSTRPFFVSDYLCLCYHWSWYELQPLQQATVREHNESLLWEEQEDHNDKYSGNV